MNMFTVNTRKQGCEVYVENEKHSYFIGECYSGTSNETVATVIKHANVICNALNNMKTQLEKK